VTGTSPSPQSITQLPTVVPLPLAKAPSQIPHIKPVTSPCFVHSHLDKGAQLTDWLNNKQSFVGSGGVGVAKSLHFSPGTSTFDSSNDSGDEDEFVGSLTKRLAETAVGVREMSKQLGTLPEFHSDAND
jgi:NAD+ kinase